jgi:hypothetical protein
MKFRIVAASAAAAVLALAGSTAAQSVTAEQREKTKIEVKNGRPVEVTGCLQRMADGPGYILTDREGGLKYALVTNDDLSKYLDRRVQVKGNASDSGDAKVKIEHKVKGTSGDTRDTKVETRGDKADLPFLGLKSIKKTADSCE